MTDGGSGRVVVNRDDLFPEVVAAAGAMLGGRTTYEVARRMAPEDSAYDAGPSAC